MVKSSQQKEKLHQLYALYEQPLYRIAYAILHQTEQAEDAVSDAFLKIIPHLDQIESPDSPKTKAFLIQVIRNTAINQYRKNAKDAERLTNIDDSTLQVPSPHNEVEQFLQPNSRNSLHSYYKGFRKPTAPFYSCGANRNNRFGKSPSGSP